jgi:hypothetical protein
MSGKCLTQHYDNARTGWNPNEDKLTVDNVKNLQELFSQQVDGTVYAQPLYVPELLMPDGYVHNVIYVATANNTVYAFDADVKLPPLWSRSLIPEGEAVVQWTDVPGCMKIGTTIGITATPVIDDSTNILYVVAKTRTLGPVDIKFYYRLYALDIKTGQDQVTGVEISGDVVGSAPPQDYYGRVVFDPTLHVNRAALLLMGNGVYVAFGSDCGSTELLYHGWIFGFSAATLRQFGAFCTTPDSDSGVEAVALGGGIDQSGMGIVGDPSEEFIYFTTGNGDFTANLPRGQNYGNTVLKLTSDFLSVADFFTPSYQQILFQNGYDLGSGGASIPWGDAPVIYQNWLLVMCGKDDHVLVIDRNNMGKYRRGGPDCVAQSFQLDPTFVWPPNFPPPKDNKLPGVWGGPASYGGGLYISRYLYYCGNGGPLKAYELGNGELFPSTLDGGIPNQSSMPFPQDNFGLGGATPIVSSNGLVSGTGIVWAITRSNPRRLQAFDAVNLTLQLCDKPAGPWGYNVGTPMNEPTVANGKVYVPADGVLTVFGLVNFSLSIDPGIVIGGVQNAAGKVTIPAPAPDEGRSFTLRSFSPLCAVPTILVIGAGETTGTFPVTTSQLGVNDQSESVTITASEAGVDVAAGSLTLLAVDLQLSIDPHFVIGGQQTAIGKVTVSGLQSSSAVSVSLLSLSPELATVPSEVTIWPGAQSGFFEVTTHATDVYDASATIQAFLFANMASATLGFLPKPRPPGAVQSVTIEPDPVLFGGTAQCTVTIVPPAVPQAITVDLSSSSPVAPVPPSVIIPLGATSTSFTISTSSAQLRLIVATISATAGGVTIEVLLNVVRELPR